MMTIIILIVWQVFHFSIMYTGYTSQCMTLNEHWMHPKTGQWPLFASFALVFVLMFFWNFCIALTPEAKSLSDRIILVCNALVLIAIALIMASLAGTAGFEHYKKHGNFEQWFERPGFPFSGPSRCEVARPYAGVWEVKKVERVFNSPEFPFQRIHFNSDLSFRATVSGSVDIIEGRWFSGEEPWYPGYIYASSKYYGTWYWRLEGGDLLMYSEKEWRPVSRVYLEKSNEPMPRGW